MKVLGSLLGGIIVLSFYLYFTNEKRAEITPKKQLIFEEKSVYKYVPNLTVENFRDMELEGTNLTFVKELKDHYSYISHEVYYLSNGVKVSGVLNIPKGDGPFPILLLNHGWYPLDLYTVPGKGLKREQDYFAKHGYVTFHTDYRDHGYSDKFVDPRDVYDGSLGYAIDSANAVNALRNLGDTRIDITRLGVLGHSMGGDIALDLLVTRPYLFDAAVLYAPASGHAWDNFNRWKHQDFSWPFIKNTLDTLGDYKSNPEVWDHLSATPFLSQVKTPIQIHHGGGDEIVPLKWSQKLAQTLKSFGKIVELRVYQEEDHEFQEQYSNYIFSAHDFLDRYVKGE